MGQSTAANLSSDPVGDASNQGWSGNSSADLTSVSLTWPGSRVSHSFQELSGASDASGDIRMTKEGACWHAATKQTGFCIGAEQQAGTADPPTETLLVACCAQLQFQSLFTSVLIEIWAVICGKCERRRDGGGSLLLGPPEPRRDGTKRESLFLLLRELGQTLLLLLTGRQNCQIKKHPVKTETSLSLISPLTCANWACLRLKASMGSSSRA